MCIDPKTIFFVQIYRIIFLLLGHFLFSSTHSHRHPYLKDFYSQTKRTEISAEGDLKTGTAGQNIFSFQRN